MINDVDDGPLHSKLHKVCISDELCCRVACNVLWHPCRKAVSGKKLRYQKDGYDLDLVYLDTKVIVHAFPAMGLEHIYRNPRHELRRFLDDKHKDHYKMYNFCCEPGRGYDPKFYYNRVERYPFKDHNIPPLETLTAFANSAKSWIEKDPLNVVNMHCKAGKGRAGLMSCCLLIRLGVAQSAQEALDLYDQRRVSNHKGLTVTSQRKTVVFYELIWRNYWKVKGNIGAVSSDVEKSYIIPLQPDVIVYGVEILDCPPGFCDSIRILIYKCGNFKPNLIVKSGAITGTYAWGCDASIQGNFKIVVEGKKGCLGQYKKIFEFIHNTLFMDTTDVKYVDFYKDHLDMKKKVSKMIPASFAIRLKLVRDESDAMHSVTPAASNGKDGYSKVPNRRGSAEVSLANEYGGKAEAQISQK